MPIAEYQREGAKAFAPSGIRQLPLSAELHRPASQCMKGRGGRVGIGGRGRGATWTSLGKPAVSPKPFNLPSRRSEGSTPLRVLGVVAPAEPAQAEAPRSLSGTSTAVGVGASDSGASQGAAVSGAVRPASSSSSAAGHALSKDASALQAMLDDEPYREEEDEPRGGSGGDGGGAFDGFDFDSEPKRSFDVLDQVCPDPHHAAHTLQLTRPRGRLQWHGERLGFTRSIRNTFSAAHATVHSGRPGEGAG